jgi:DNA-binding CsgD family transcriptional regulator
VNDARAGKAADVAGWPIVARSDVIRLCAAALAADSEYRGVVLVGEAGVGKTTVARQLVRAADPMGKATTRFVLGTQTGRGTPLGAFCRLLPADAAKEPAGMLAAAHRVLAEYRDLILVVDDAHQLDSLSALLLQQVADAGTARLIVTVRPDDDLPDAVTASWKDGSLLRVDLARFTRAESSELIGAALGGDIDDRTVDRLHDFAGGSPLMLRGVIAAAQSDGALEHTGGGWRLTGPLSVSPDVRELIGSRLATMSDDEIDVVETVSVADVLDLDILRELFASDLIDRVERRGAIQIVDDGPNVIARPGHPIVGEVVRARLGSTRSRDVNAILARHLSDFLDRKRACRESADPHRRIQLAQFMIRGSGPQDLNVVNHAAASAVTMSDLTLGEELARFAFDHGGGLDSATILAEALSWRGRGDEAETILAQFDPDGSDPLLTARWGGLRAANLYFGCGRVAAARDMLATVTRRVSDPRLLNVVVAMEVSFAFYGADMPSAVALGTSALERLMLPHAVVWAGMVTAGALAMSGRFNEVGPVAARALAAADHCESGPQRYVIGVTEVLAHVGAGDLDAAERVGQRYSAMTSGVPQAEAMVCVLQGRVDLARGRLAVAAEELRTSLGRAWDSLQTGLTMLVAAWLTQAEAARGAVDAAEVALERAERAAGPQFEVFQPELGIAHAWVHAALGETTVARWHAGRAADLAHDAGMFGTEMAALHAALRFGEHANVARMRRLAHRLECPMASAMGEHGRAVLDHDGPRLDAVSESFAKLGAMALAADAAAHAAQEHSRVGNVVRQVNSTERARRLAAACGLRSPAVMALEQPLPITGREREVAILVGRGLTSREIADLLGVSVRTIDGHLYRIFPKVGVENREQLARLIRRDAESNLK